MVTHGNSLFKHIFAKIVRSWNVGLHGNPGNAWLGHTLFQFLKPHFDINSELHGMPGLVTRCSGPLGLTEIPSGMHGLFKHMMSTQSGEKLYATLVNSLAPMW